MIAKQYCISSGKGKSTDGLPSFDKALLDAGVGNYNLVRLSSILPAKCEEVDVKDIANYITEGSLLPTAYSTITSDVKGDIIVSAIGVGIPKDKNHVGVIMEYSSINKGVDVSRETLHKMIREAFEVRNWELESIKDIIISDIVTENRVKHTTFACIAEW